MRRRGLYLAVAICLVALAHSGFGAVDHIDEFNKARRNLQPQLRSKQPAARAAAISQLQAFPIAEAVRLIHNSLADADPKVRDTAYGVLVKMSGNQEVCDTLVLLVKKNMLRDETGQAVAPALAAILSSPLTSVRRDSLEFVDGTIARSKNGVQFLVTFADELGAHRAASDVVPLLRLSKTRAFADHFGIRRAVVNALVHISAPEAIGALVEIMDHVGGEAKADAVEHLTQVTSQIFGMEGAAWARWWDDVKETYQYPTRSIETPYRSVALESPSGSYYGLPLFAERAVFVLDTSGSMTGQRIVAAKRELIKAIDGLPDYVSFGVVVFNGSVSVWHKQLVKATDETKKAACHYVDVQIPQSNTASYDALETALSFDTEAIFFLSDGAPHGGKITAPVDIVEAITAVNRSRRVSIYTIGIGAGIPGGPLDLFLKTLAEQNFGLYRRVDG